MIKMGIGCGILRARRFGEREGWFGYGETNRLVYGRSRYGFGLACMAVCTLDGDIDYQTIADHGAVTRTPPRILQWSSSFFSAAERSLFHTTHCK